MGLALASSQAFARPTVLSVTMSAFDRSSGDDVSCDLHRTDHAGTDLATAPAQTTNSQTGVYDKTFNLSSGVPAVDSWWASCNIPGMTTGGFSHLVSFKVTTSD
jgi:hypothetical protein